MDRIDLNDLTHWSPWPSRLLDLSEWVIPTRTINKVDDEYDKDKYARCLEYFVRETGTLSPESVKQFEFGCRDSETMCISQKERLFLTNLAQARKLFYDFLIQSMHREIEQVNTLVELGCGYGYNLWLLCQAFGGSLTYMGGEYSANAVALASKLYRKEDHTVSVLPLDFYDSTYQILEVAQGPLLVFTVHALEQLPSADCFFQALLQYQDKISAVFHFEPIWELHGESLLGLMRRRYAEMNDYNRDLYSQILGRSHQIRLEKVETDILGLNPLNPTSLLFYRFIDDD